MLPCKGILNSYKIFITQTSVAQPRAVWDKLPVDATERRCGRATGHQQAVPFANSLRQSSQNYLLILPPCWGHGVGAWRHVISDVCNIWWMWCSPQRSQEVLLSLWPREQRDILGTSYNGSCDWAIQTSKQWGFRDSQCFNPDLQVFTTVTYRSLPKLMQSLLLSGKRVVW